MEKNEASESSRAGRSYSWHAPLSTSTFQRRTLHLAACLNSPVSLLSPSNCQRAVTSHQCCTCCFSPDHKPTSTSSWGWANSLIGRPRWVLKPDMMGRWRDLSDPYGGSQGIYWLLLACFHRHYFYGYYCSSYFCLLCRLFFWVDFILSYVLYSLFCIAVHHGPLGKHNSTDLYVRHRLIADKGLTLSIHSWLPWTFNHKKQQSIRYVENMLL